MNDVIDISLPLHNGMVCWPTSTGFHLSRTMEMAKGDPANNSRIDTDVHIGTHVDAPWHSLNDGLTVEHMPLDSLIGPAYVVSLVTVHEITAQVLERASIPKGVERLLLQTRNSEFWAADLKEFRTDFVGLTLDAAEWIVKRGLRLIGIDYLSIQRYGDSMETHNVMLRNNIVIVEGLNLTGVQSQMYELICLPLKIVGSEGAPARAVLRKLPTSQ